MATAQVQLINEVVDLSSRAQKWFNYWMYDIADPRTDDWFMVSSPFQVFGLGIFYVYFVCSLGPRLMADRKPFQLRNFIIAYNCVQIVTNFLLFSELLYLLPKIITDWRCQAVDFSRSPLALRTAAVCWWYYMLKISELTDTVVFVLRRRQEKVTVLHVFHHGGMVAMTWGVTKYFPGGQLWLVGTCNTFVHVVMYYYYLRMAMTSGYDKELRWKKSLTRLQFTQFFVCLVHGSNVLFYDCGYPKILGAFCIMVGCILIGLFINFYIQTYKKKKKHME